ncbi:MAG: HPr family phosphocarrier protein [bacterium]
MIKQNLEVVNTLGIHARPAALIVKTVNNYNCSVFLEKDGIKVDAKSVLGVMMLAAPKGSSITAEISGDDEQQCLEALEEIFAQGFNED